jgi:hypothetical protein
LLEKRIAFDIAARPALPAVAETAHPMPDVEKKRSAIPVLRGSTITIPFAARRANGRTAIPLACALDADLSLMSPAALPRA